MIRIAPDTLEKNLIELFRNYGAFEQEAQEVSSHLVMSNLLGHDSHGVLRAPWYIEKIQKGEIVPGASIAVELETPSSAVVNGHWGFGQPIARFAMELAMKKALTQVVACVTVRNCNHIGRLGAYTSLAVAQGMVGMGMANLHGTSHVVAPFGGIDRRLPTNPISIAFPRDGQGEFLLDMSTSMVAEGTLKMKLQQKESLPEGWIIDSEGNSALDPKQFYHDPRGAILPLGGISAHKGFALSLAIDALSGALSGAQCSNAQATRHGNACWFLALRIEAFTPLTQFRKKVDSLCRHVKSSRLAKGISEILVPGEPEQRHAEKSRQEGIYVDDLTWGQLCQKADLVELDFRNKIESLK